MVLCIFTTYGMIPRQVHELDPKSRLYRTITYFFERSGPLYRLLMRLKLAPVTWFEKWLTYITGQSFTSGHLQEIGERIFNLERMYNLREGISGAQDTLPHRMLHESTFPHLDSGHPLDQLLPRYYEIRGWDAEGVPLQRTLDRLQVRT